MTEGFSKDLGKGDRPLPDGPSTIGRPEGGSSGIAILLIEDNPAIAGALGIALRMAGYRLETANGPEEAWSRLARQRYAAILLDMNFGAGMTDGEEGLACLRRIVADDPHACVIVITAHSGVRIAVAAMQEGARDFVMKPWRNADLIAKLRAGMSRRPMPTAARVSMPENPVAMPVTLIGESRAMQELRGLIHRVGPTAASVTVTGRSGSGRTSVARAIIAASNGADDPIPRIDLRRDDHLARMRAASGTVILRHADHLDPIAQETLLEHTPADIRCIALAETLEPLVPALRRRIATVEVAVPPLATRGDDAVLLARHFAHVAAERFGRPRTRLTPAAEAIVRSARWSDEVRGLALAMERAVILADDGMIDAALLASPGPIEFPAGPDEQRFGLVDAERTMIEAALRQHHHNVTRAAVALGLSRGALYRRMARHGL